MFRPPTTRRRTNMDRKTALGKVLIAGALAGFGFGASAWGGGGTPQQVEHVLVISVDGLHAVDAERFIETHPKSALAEIAGHAVRYTTAATSRPSDSFPGVL